LTFDELEEIFEALEINPAYLSEDNKEQSSSGGRIYARTGGVSTAVKNTVERIKAQNKPRFKAVQADGVSKCKKMLAQLKNNQIQANFIEGMGCEGGCAGGPKRIINSDKATEHIERYAGEARVKNPIDNLNAMHILKYLSGLEKENKELIDELAFDKLLLR
ncbi:MAG TPA: [Fe-Fe] hydrogenase large subunit C-terminal domain-containing protein, partial [Halanaerobiales bacterium]|nr:[Fe-Fe] hydrogenase large subunit C-terminal domain-containing protein [Halanaerobiales bacterium]